MALDHLFLQAWRTRDERRQIFHGWWNLRKRRSNLLYEFADAKLEPQLCTKKNISPVWLTPRTRFGNGVRNERVSPFKRSHNTPTLPQIPSWHSVLSIFSTRIDEFPVLFARGTRGWVACSWYAVQSTAPPVCLLFFPSTWSGAVQWKRGRRIFGFLVENARYSCPHLIMVRGKIISFRFEYNGEAFIHDTKYNRWKWPIWFFFMGFVLILFFVFCCLGFCEDALIYWIVDIIAMKYYWYGLSIYFFWWYFFLFLIIIILFFTYLRYVRGLGRRRMRQCLLCFVLCVTCLITTLPK